MVSIAVTGATGQLGGRVSRILDRRGVIHAVVARDPTRLPTLPRALATRPAAYDDADFATAVAGTDTMLLVSAGLSGRRLAEHTAAVQAATAVGVSRVVYVSLLGAAPDATYINARDHWQTEQMLAASSLRWTVVRPSYYSSTLARLVDANGVVRGPAPSGRVSLVSHDDIAEVLVTILRDGSNRYDGAVVEVTGPEAVTLEAAAQRLRQSLGQVQGFEAISARECRRLRSMANEPPHEAEGWVSWFQSIQCGEVAAVSGAVRSATGRHPQPLEAAAAGS